jgi:hypothetical protein
MAEATSKDRIGNEVKSQDMVMIAVPDHMIQGYITSVTPASLLQPARGRPLNNPAVVTVMAKFDIPVDPATGRMVNGVRVYDPTPELTAKMFGVEEENPSK